jgi:fatty acid desaturase
MTRQIPTIEIPTLALIAACYAVWALGTVYLPHLSLSLSIIVTALAITLHSSLCHEALHGHPTRIRWLNELLLFPSLILVIPYGRFRDTHLDHHVDERLTDPYDDPETNYLDPSIWAAQSAGMRSVLRFNNTLLGRLTVGPALSLVFFVAGDIRAARAGDKRVLRGWLWHVPALALVLAWLAQVATMPFWTYLIAAYAAMSILKIRTFLEHRAHERAQARTVIVEDRGPLAFLFLNNNLHVVHHTHPGTPWYRLWALYAARRGEFLSQNEGYRYDSYAEIFARHFLRTKDPVPHPLRDGPEG